MARTEETLQLQAKNNKVKLATEAGKRLATCTNCYSEWTPPTTAGGWPTKTWFLCPNLCNLSQRLAARFLDEMEQGSRPHDEELASRCRDRLAGVRKNMRERTFKHVIDNALDYLVDEVERRDEWHRRNSEWDADLEEEMRDFT